MEHETSQYLTTRDAGKLIDRTPAAIRRAAALGLLRPVVVTSAGERLYSSAAVLAYAARTAQRTRRRAEAAA